MIFSPTSLYNLSSAAAYASAIGCSKIRIGTRGDGLQQPFRRQDPSRHNYLKKLIYLGPLNGQL
jgi:hypothetical protein